MVELESYVFIILKNPFIKNIIGLRLITITIYPNVFNRTPVLHIPKSLNQTCNRFVALRYWGYRSKNILKKMNIYLYNLTY